MRNLLPENSLKVWIEIEFLLFSFFNIHNQKGSEKLWKPKGLIKLLDVSDIPKNDNDNIRVMLISNV